MATDSSRFSPEALLEGVDRWGPQAPDLAVEALALTAEGAFSAGDYSGGLALLRRAELDRLQPDDHAPRSAAAFSAGLCRLGMLELVDATGCFDQARRHAENGDDAWRLSIALGRLALVWLHRGDPDECLRWCERARAIERPTNNWSELAIVETIAASANAAAGNVDAALDLADDALALTRRSSYRWTRLPSMTVLLFCATKRNDPSHAKAILADIASAVSPRAASPWAELVSQSLEGVDAPGESWHPRTAVLDGTADLRYLTNVALWTSIQRGRGVRSSVPALDAAVAAGVRYTPGWPFDLRRLTTQTS
jgi:tetratricopeptide (TPR) repeat protein